MERSASCTTTLVLVDPISSARCLAREASSRGFTTVAICLSAGTHDDDDFSFSFTHHSLAETVDVLQRRVVDGDGAFAILSGSDDGVPLAEALSAGVQESRFSRRLFPEHAEPQSMSSSAPWRPLGCARAAAPPEIIGPWRWRLSAANRFQSLSSWLKAPDRRDRNFARRRQLLARTSSGCWRIAYKTRRCSCKST